ncbi:MAG: MinD/ParA family protein [Pyrinomonadaceae bacterium]
MEEHNRALRAITSMPFFDPKRTTIAEIGKAGGYCFPSATRTIAITCGKGGVGKTNVAVNLAAALAGRSQRVLLVDADLGLANADVLFGLSPQWHIGHVLAGQRTLKEITLRTESEVRLIPGGSGVPDLANLTQGQQRQLVAELRAMEDDADFIIVDTAAGIAGNVTGVLAAASEAIVVSTPDPASVIDAYATIKVLHQHSPVKPIWLVINNAHSIAEAEQAYHQISVATLRFLNRKLDHLGTIPNDPQLRKAVLEQVPVLVHSPQAISTSAFHLIAKTLLRPHFKTSEMSSVREFWGLLTKVKDFN